MTLTIEQLERLTGTDTTSDMPPYCLACGYNLTGAVSNRCSECGQTFNRRAWRKRAIEIKFQVRRVEESLGMVPGGLYVAIIGAGVRLGTVALGVGSIWEYLGRAVAFLCGFTGLFLGLGYFRMLKLPPWAREQIRVERKGHMAYGAIVVGATILVTSVFSPW